MDNSVKNALTDPVTFTLDLSTQKPYHFWGIFWGLFPRRSLNTLGSFVFELYCGQTDTQTDRQTEPYILPTPTDSVGVGNKDMYRKQTNKQTDSNVLPTPTDRGNSRLQTGETNKQTNIQKPSRKHYLAYSHIHITH